MTNEHTDERTDRRRSTDVTDELKEQLAFLLNMIIAWRK